MSPPSSADAEVLRFANDLERRLEPLDRGILLAEWKLVSGRSTAGSAAWQTRRHDLLEEPGLLDRIRRYRANTRTPRLQRRLELAERAVLESRIEQGADIVELRSGLQRRIAAFRPRWHGRRVGRAVVRHALRTSPDRRVRERAFYSLEPLHRSLEAGLVELAALRNARAREFGYGSFPDFRLTHEGLAVGRLEELVDTALRHVPSEMRRRRDDFEDRTGDRGWYPWDVSFAEQLGAGLPDAAFPPRSALDSVLAGVRRWGFAPRTLRFRIDRHDLSAGGICLAPDPPRDVRIVVHPGGGWTQSRILFHEVGHAVASASVRQPSHLLRWHENLPGFAGLSEGEGQFFDQIGTSEAWLRSATGLPPAQLAPAVLGARRAPLATVGFLAAWITQELALYLRPRDDLAEVGPRFFRRTMWFDSYRSPSFTDPFFVELPVYSPSYLYAELLRPQLTAAVLDAVGGELWPNPRVGPWLVEHWMRDGSSYDWWKRLREVGGRPFGAGAFNAEMRTLVR
jgi:hypothetical protein